MKISEVPVSAFAVYADKFKQKKKSKLAATNGISKLAKKHNSNNKLKINKMNEEIGFILSKLVEQSKSSSNVNLEKKLNEASFVRKSKKHNKNDANMSSKFENNSSRNKIETEQVKLRTDSLKNVCNGTNKNKNVKTFKQNKNIDSNIKNIPIIGVENKIHKTQSNQDIKNGVKTGKKYEKKKRLDKPTTTNKNLCMPTFENKDTASSNSNEIHVFKEGSSLKLGNKKRKKSDSRKEFRKKKAQIGKSIGSVNQENSILSAKRVFEWLICPVSQQDFMRLYWEKQPLLIQRDMNRNYFSELLSTPAIDSMLRENTIFFTKHLDVTSYTNGERETHNLSGRAQANVVWDFYSNGCSIRLLNPQAFIPNIHTLNAILQEYFGCFVGANVYLTPPNSQGFAPHYDDIEAFVLQIEGKKHWKVYPPRNDKETLPRDSSPNFSQDEIGNTFLDVILEPGDILYFPRGFIHQASTVDGEHSLHITLSAYQKTAWVDLFEKALPIALKKAAIEDVDFRRGLPRNYLGIEHHGSEATKASFLETAQNLMSRLGHFLSLSLGGGVDQMGAQFMHDALPPVFTPEEKLNSGLAGGLKMKENGKLVDRIEFEQETRVKLVRANICRLVEEENEVRLYHCLDNPLEYHAEEPQFLVLPPEGVSVITFLSCKYPAFVKVKQIPHDDDEALLALVSDLWDAGLLTTEDLQKNDDV